MYSVLHVCAIQLYLHCQLCKRLEVSSEYSLLHFSNPLGNNGLSTMLTDAKRKTS